tara:strand:+ start:181 stop:1491 length:1311 start_codon:yes stop_codon:yes gene_type:complete
MQSIPPFDPLYLSEYIDYWKKLYNDAFQFSKQNPAAILPTKEQVEEVEKNIEHHLRKHYPKLKSIVDDDFFEWNQSMIVFICLCQYRQIHSPTHNHAQMATLCKKWNVLRPSADTLAEAVLLLKHIDDQWARWDFADLKDIEKYLRIVHRTISKFVCKAGTMRVFNRWDLIEEINKDTFRLNPKGIFFLVSNVAMQLKHVQIGQIVQPLIETTPVEITDADRVHFLKWVEDQNTYYNIRTFRDRISAFVWEFLHDEAGRNMHTYLRAGEVPTKFAYVTAKYPSGWVGNMQHQMLYADNAELIQTNNLLIRDSNIIALFEAVVKTLYSFELIKYCFCNEENIVEMHKGLLLAQHPIIVRAWAKWGVSQKGKLYFCTDVIDAILLWMHFVKTDHDCTLMRSFNLTNLINQCTRINKDFDVGNDNEGTESSNNVFEVCL